MTRIGGSNAWAALVRAQPGSTDRRLRQPAPAASNAATGTRQGAYPLSSALVQRLRALRPDDGQRARKAFRLFLESVLLQEFGPQLANDAGFDEWVEQVLQQMSADHELRGAMEEAAQALLVEAGAALPAATEGGMPTPLL